MRDTAWVTSGLLDGSRRLFSRRADRPLWRSGQGPGLGRLEEWPTSLVTEAVRVRATSDIFSGSSHPGTEMGQHPFVYCPRVIWTNLSGVGDTI